MLLQMTPFITVSKENVAIIRNYFCKITISILTGTVSRIFIQIR